MKRKRAKAPAKSAAVNPLRKVQTTVAMTPVLRNRVDRVAEGLGISRSELVARALDAFLDEAEVASRLLGNVQVRDRLLAVWRDPQVVKVFINALGDELSERERQKVLSFLAPARGGS